ncbi:MAG: CopG family transcriptional regulator [Ignavibacteria bacterium]|mgnify:CR=1 FL=1|nr:MAG: CopG family transcriptional regulator [Ignavibacteria bacterium]
MQKRTTIYLDPDLHRALRLKAIETEKSVSELINEAVKQSLSEDEEDLRSFEERAAEPTLSYDAVLKDLKKHGKI